MTDNLSDNSDNLDAMLDPDDLIEDDVKEVDFMVLSKIEFQAKSFENQRTDISTFSKNLQNAALKSMGADFHSLFSQDGYVKYSKTSREQLENYLCIFIDELLKLNKPQNGEEATTNASAATQAQIDNLKTQNESLTETVNQLRAQLEAEKQRTKNSEQGVNSMSAELEEIREEKLALEEKSNKQIKEILLLKNELDQTTRNLKDEIEKVNDALTTELDMKKITESQLERSNQQLNEANEELVSLRTENATWKTKIDNQSEKVSNLKQKINELNVTVKTLEAERDEYQIDNNNLKRQIQESSTKLRGLDSTEVDSLRETNKHYNSLIDRLNNMFEEQNIDRANLENNHKRAIELLIEQQNLLSQYEQELETVEGERKEMDKKTSNYQKSVTGMEEQIQELEKEIETYRQDKESNELDKIKKLLVPRFGDDVNVTETIQGLLNGTTDNEMKEMNQGLFQVIDEILNFWTRVINEGNVKNVLNTTASPLKLQPSKPSSRKFMQDTKVENDLLVQIAYYRQAAMQYTTNDVSDFPSQDSTEKILKRLKNSESEFDQQSFYIISTGAMVSEVLRNLYQRAQYGLKTAMSDLAPASEILNFDSTKDSETELPRYISEKMQTFKAFKERVIKLVDTEDNDPDVFDQFLKFLMRYLSNSAMVLNTIKQDLRPLVEEPNSDDELALSDVVDLAVEKLIQATSDNAKRAVQDSRQVDSQLSSMEEQKAQQNEIKQLTEEKENQSKAIQNLEKNNAELQSQVDQLNKQVESEQQKNQELNNKLKKVNESYSLSEQNNTELRNETKTLRESMEKARKMAEQRFNKSMDDERNKHEAELQAQKLKSYQSQQELQAQLDEQTAKSKKLKAQMKKYLNDYQQAFAKQKETAAVLKRQNEELNQRVTKLNEQTANQKELDRMKAEAKTLETERLLLSTKLKQAQENVEKVQAMRDNYWLAQMTVREAEMNRSITDAANEANERLYSFIDQIATEIEAYLPTERTIDEESILQTLQTITRRLEDSEAQVSTLKAKGNNSFSLDEQKPTTESNSKALAALREWDRWARDLFVNFTDGEVPCQSCKDLRFILGEMILASISNRSLIFRMESLRFQKNYLMRFLPQPDNEEEEPVTLTSVMAMVMGLCRIMKKYGFTPIHMSQLNYSQTPDLRKSKTSTPRTATPKTTTPRTTPKKGSFI